MDRCEMAAAVLEPHFDAVREAFVDFSPEAGKRLKKLVGTRMVVDDEVHDSPRHFGMCRDDGLLIRLAPEAVLLPLEQLVAVLVHEFGHAADFAYPACWVTPDRGVEKAVWIGDRGDKPARKWRRLWADRTSDQLEWAADSIAQAVTGRPVRYCDLNESFGGDGCVIQCFSGSRSRPANLR